MKKISIVILLLLIGVFSAYSQGKGKSKKTNSKYRIEFTINGVHDTVIYVGHHLGEKKYVIDTIALDANGYGVMEGNKHLYKGIYIVVLPSRNMNFFEFLMPDENERHFSLTNDITNLTMNLKVKNSPTNQAFSEYQRGMSEYGAERVEIDKMFKDAGEDTAARNIAQDKLKDHNERRIKYMSRVENDNKDNVFGTILRSIRDIEIPDFPRDEQGNITDSTFKYRYYKEHYFDNIDFKEEGLVRTPIYQSKLDYFIKNMVVPSPDSLIVDANKVIKMTYDEGFMKGDTLVYQFTLAHLLQYFEESKVMGYDAVFVAIAEDWYLSDKAPWADTAFLHKLKDRVEKITPTRLGSTAYNLQKMQSLDDRYYTLSDVRADYTVVVFWEPSCGHCQKEVPKLFKEYEDTLRSLGVKVFALYTQYDKTEWEKFINEKELQTTGWLNVWDGPYPHSRFRDFYDIYSTPVIYILDKNKKIIGKRINVDDIKGLIDYENKRVEYNKKHNIE